MTDSTNETVETTPETFRRIKGKITGVNKEKGYGFITSSEIEFTRIFFHWTALIHETKNFKELKKGDKVLFTPVEVEGQGWRALKIEVLDNA